MDDRLRAQLPKVEVVDDLAIEVVLPKPQRVAVKFTTTDGRGFDAPAEPVLDAAPRRRLKDAVWNLENVEKVGDLMAMTQARYGI